jgi:FKBP-type peptidyl-prolyl cis-trans isomerase
MRSGGRRLLLVPPGLAFGQKGVSGVVPANASLMFLIELVSVEKAQ